MIGLPSTQQQGVGPTHAEALLRIIEAAAEVRRRSQFFHWLLSCVSAMLPDQVAICGAWHAGQKELVFEQFNSILLPEATLADLTGPSTPLLRAIGNEWVRRGDPSCVMPLCGQPALAGHLPAPGLMAIGVTELLVHGVARPQRSHEIETLFIFAAPAAAVEPRHLHGLDLIGPHLHHTYLRTLGFESNLKPKAGWAVPALRAEQHGGRLLTRREMQTLTLIRDGMNNAQIGNALAISPLTAKNHVQKLLRKLGATNRAQAVARAMALGALEGADVAAAAAALPGHRPTPTDTGTTGPN